MDDWEIICHAYIWTEIDLDSNVRNYYVNRQVRAFLGDTNQSRPDLKFWNI